MFIWNELPRGKPRSIKTVSVVLQIFSHRSSPGLQHTAWLDLHCHIDLLYLHNIHWSKICLPTTFSSPQGGAWIILLLLCFLSLLLFHQRNLLEHSVLRNEHGLTRSQSLKRISHIFPLFPDIWLLTYFLLMLSLLYDDTLMATQDDTARDFYHVFLLYARSCIKNIHFDAYENLRFS